MNSCPIWTTVNISVGTVSHRFQFWLQQTDRKYYLHVDLQCKLLTCTVTFVWFQVLWVLDEFIVNLCFHEYCDVMKVLFLNDGIGYSCKLDVFFILSAVSSSVSLPAHSSHSSLNEDFSGELVISQTSLRGH